jgi:hypothetical protein
MRDSRVSRMPMPQPLSLQRNTIMNDLTTPFHLSASASALASPAEPTADLPVEVAGQPASYFWKEMIHAGSYAHPTRGYSLAVDDARMTQWAQTGAKMLAAGLAIPINCDHSDRARDVVGYVKDVKLEGDRLLALCQFIGEDAIRTAARNLVSVGIDPDFTDGQGRNWGEAIVHLALTPVPVVPDQGEFEKVQSQPLIAQGSPAPLSNQADESAQLRAQLFAAQQRIAELSSKLPQPMSHEAEAAMIESATAKFDLAVLRGALSPAARDQLVAALVQSPDGRPNLITLSRFANPRGDHSLAMTIANALLDNDPIDTGELTGLQTMARAIPGEASSSIDQLRTYMTKVASVSG